MVASLPSLLHQVKAKGKREEAEEELKSSSRSGASSLLPFVFPEGFAFRGGFCYSLR
jgi:hypothetical protein